MSSGHEIPKSGSRRCPKLRVILLVAVLSSEAALLVSLNSWPVTYKKVKNGVMIADDFRGWPAIFWTHRREHGGSIRNEIHSHIVRNQPIALNVGVSICLLALSVFVVRRRHSLRMLLVATLLIAVLCALFVEASKQEYQPPIPSVWLRLFIHD